MREEQANPSSPYTKLIDDCIRNGNAVLQPLTLNLDYSTSFASMIVALKMKIIGRLFLNFSAHCRPHRTREDNADSLTEEDVARWFPWIVSYRRLPAEH